METCSFPPYEMWATFCLDDPSEVNNLWSDPSVVMLSKTCLISFWNGI